jgi:hypothetical protein
LGMGTMKVILPSILSFIWNKKAVILDGKAWSHWKPWRPFTREPATHPLTPKLSPHVICPVPPGYVLKCSWGSQGHMIFNKGSGPSKEYLPPKMIFSHFTEVFKFLKLSGGQTKGPKRKSPQKEKASRSPTLPFHF